MVIYVFCFSILGKATPDACADVNGDCLHENVVRKGQFDNDFMFVTVLLGHSCVYSRRVVLARSVFVIRELP